MDTVISNKHTALFYDSEEEYYDIVTPFIKSGLENNEFVLWTLPEFIRVEDANIYLHKFLENLAYFIKNEQILIQDYKTTYMNDGIFSLERMINSWKGLEKKALEKGFNGVYAVGDGGWAKKNYWIDLIFYESEIDRIIENYRMRAVCTYSKKDIEINQILDIGKNHQEVIVKQRGDWNRLTPADF